MRLELAQRRQRHAKIHCAQWPATNDAPFPTLFLGDLFNLFLRSRVKAHQPVVAADVAVRLSLRLEPRIAQLDADRFAGVFSETIKSQARVHLRKMMV